MESRPGEPGASDDRRGTGRPARMGGAVRAGDERKGKTAPTYSNSKFNRVDRKGGQLRHRARSPYLYSAGPKVFGPALLGGVGCSSHLVPSPVSVVDRGAQPSARAGQALPGGLSTNLRFNHARYNSYNQLFDSLRKGMDVQATFEGRFEAVYSWQNHKQIWIAGARENQRASARSIRMVAE